MLRWQEIDTVLLDMDGTLLDLHFDNHFWMEHIPAILAKRDGIDPDQSREMMWAEYEKVAGTISWYCLDFWSEKLNLDILAAKREIEHLISMRDDTLPFLDALNATGRKIHLVTNAHPDNLSMKVERTKLDSHFDNLISTHQFGVSKESQELWQKLQAHIGFDASRTLFVDDNIGILQAAQQFGIKYNLAVSNPDSKKENREITEFPSVSDYRTILDDIHRHPVQSGE